MSLYTDPQTAALKAVLASIDSTNRATDQLLKALVETFNGCWKDPVAWAAQAGPRGQELFAFHGDATLLVVRAFCRRKLAPPIAAVRPLPGVAVAPRMTWVKYVGPAVAEGEQPLPADQFNPANYAISLPAGFTIVPAADGSLAISKNE